MANQRIFRATKPAHCGKCGKAIEVGEHITWPRRGASWYRVHVHCGEPCKCEENTPIELSTPVSHANGNGNGIAPVAPDGASAAVGALAAVIEPLIASRVLSADAIKDLIAEEVAVALEQQPEAEPKLTKLEIRSPIGTVTIDGKVHKLFKKLLGLIGQRKDTYLYGAPGGGKSTAVKKAAEASGLKYACISLNVQTVDSKLQGYLDAQGRYVSTEFRRLYETGGVYLIDECDNATGNLLTTLNTALANGHHAFPDGVVERHKDFVCIATGNTSGRGASRQHADRRQFDAAFSDRFYFMAWDYDEELERSAAEAYTPRAAAWVDWVQAIRSYCKHQSLHHIVVTPRASIEGAKLIAAGFSADRELADGLVFKGLEANQIEPILSVHPLPNN